MHLRAGWKIHSGHTETIERREVEAEDLKSYVGHKVKVTGTNNPVAIQSDASRSSASSNGTIIVTKLKVISKRCNIDSGKDSEKSWTHMGKIMAWPEVTWFYPPEIKSAYYAGTLFREWFNKYPPLSEANPNGHYLFRDRMLKGRDMPHSGPMKGACFFREFYMGMQYLDAGYEVMVYQRKVEDELCFSKACELFGDADGCTDAGHFIVPTRRLVGGTRFNRLQTGHEAFPFCGMQRNAA